MALLSSRDSWRTREAAKLRMIEDDTNLRTVIIAALVQITGHKTDSIFRGYSIVSVDDKRAALKKQLEFLRGNSVKSDVAEFPNMDRARTIE